MSPQNHPAVVALAEGMNRTIASISMRIANFKSLDPAYSGRGLAGGTGDALFKRVWHPVRSTIATGFWPKLAAIALSRICSCRRARGWAVFRWATTPNAVQFSEDKMANESVARQTPSQSDVEDIEAALQT